MSTKQHAFLLSGNASLSIADINKITINKDLIGKFEKICKTGNESITYSPISCQQCTINNQECTRHEPKCLSCFVSDIDCSYDASPIPNEKKIKLTPQQQQKIQLLQSRKHEQVIPDKPKRPRGRPRLRPKTPPSSRPVVAHMHIPVSQIPLINTKTKKSEPMKPKVVKRVEPNLNDYLYRYPYLDTLYNAIPPPWVVFQHQTQIALKRDFADDEDDEESSDYLSEGSDGTPDEMLEIDPMLVV